MSEQSLRVSVPCIWPVVCSSGLYESSETSAGTAAIPGNPVCNLHRRHVVTSPTQQGAAQVLAFLEKLGFLVKMEKCSVTPCQCVVFLGAQLDSSTMALPLPQPKLNSIGDACQLLLIQRSRLLRTLSILIRRMGHASQTRIMLAPLHYRSLLRLHLQAVAPYGHGGNVT